MTLLKSFVVGAAIFASALSYAEDGYDRSIKMNEQFRADQKRIHGNESESKNTDELKVAYALARVPLTSKNLNSEILVGLAPVEQLAGIDTMAPSHHRDALPGAQAFPHHGQLLLGAPAATPLLAEELHGFIVAVSHKHNHLPIPCYKGKRCPVFQGTCSQYCN